MNQEKLDQIFELFKRGFSRKEIAIGANVSISELDNLLKTAFTLLKESLPKKEFDLEARTFTEEGFNNNLAYLNAPIEVNDGFTDKQVQHLATLQIFKIWQLATSKSPIREKLHGHFTCDVKLPIKLTKDQDPQLVRN